MKSKYYVLLTNYFKTRYWNNFFDKSKWCRNSLVKLFKIITLVCTCIWYKCFVLFRCEYNVGAHTSVRLSSFSPLSQYRNPIWLLSWMPFNGVAWVRRDRELCRITWHYFLEIGYNCNETLFDRKLHYFGKFNKNMFWVLYQITNILYNRLL